MQLAKALVQVFTGKTIEEMEAAPAKPKREKPQYTAINTSRGGHNMPRFQPCPLDHGQKKRAGKTMGGALYYCNKCDTNFFVSHP